MAKVTRRNFVAAAVAAGAIGPAGEAIAEGPVDAAGNLTDADVAALDRISGRSTNEAERRQMLGALAEGRTSALAVRTSAYAHPYDPAFVFDARLPGTPMPPKGPVKISRKRPARTLPPPEQLAFASATELSRWIKARTLSSEALTRLYLERLRTYGPRLLCLVELVEAQALEEARAADLEIAAGRWRGPLHGIPYGLKDLFAAKGTRTTYGAPPFRDQRIPMDATVVERLRAAGAILVAKLSLGELAMGDVWFGGTTRNPWNPARGSSGSSAGSASAVAAGLVGFAIGTETYGSIVSPSRVCGTTGLRPTFGRVSRHGAMALSWTMDKVGPIARSVEDCAHVFAAIHGPDGFDRTVVDAEFAWQPDAGLAGIRVGYDQKAFESARPEQKDVPTVLRRLGVEPVPVQLPAPNPAYDALPDLTILTEGAAAFADLAARGGLRELVQQSDFSWPNQLRFGATVSAADYLNAQRVRRHLQHAMERALEAVDVYVVPAGAAPSITWTNLTGHPTCIARCGKTASGLPVSIEFTGRLFREDLVLRVAHAFEQATEWHRQWPDVTKLPEVPPALRQASSEAEED